MMFQGISGVLKLIRPTQWIKNFFVFLPIFFGGELWEIEAVIGSIIAFISFCLISSSVYCLNDFKDIEYDRLHPEKSQRPLASGQVAISTVKILIPLLVILSLSCSFLLPAPKSYKLCFVVLTYLILNIGYTYKLKQISIIDVLIIAIGFVLRIVAGGVCSGVWLSPWIILMTFLLSLFLAFSKRRDDVLKMTRENIVLRKNINQYNIEFITLILGILASVTIVCYILYTMSPEVMIQKNGNNTFFTSFFVIAAILRYLQITLVSERSGSPTKILIRDLFIQICIGLWIFSFIIIIYF